MPILSEEEIFAAALEQPSPHERRAFLDRACQGDAHLRAQVEALLAAHDHPDSFLEPPAAGVAGTVDVPPLQEKPGTLIGPYKLLQQIGEGGMGVVWMAEQTQPVQRKVALKVIKPGMDSRQVIARFEAERQALAMMDHVNIARVFDAGATDAGRPYFVMELVHGVPITQYCDDNHLTPRERLELFVPVCQAIQHAHQKGIIHRDVKPSNVMITLYDGEPVPKVIDFGVAKAMGQQLTEKTLFTDFTQMIGTPLYMSPEQAEMSALGVDTRSDIYSLGVLLYELLTGSTPLSHKRVKEAAFAEILRMIKEEEPPKPSTRLSDSGEALASISAQRHMEPAKLTKLVKGELDWIVMKTLEKDRNRRYETASGFAADVQRYLNDEQVQACPPSATYRLKKFLRRNKGAVLAAAVVVLALVAGIIGTTWGMIRAADAEASAVQEAEQKELALNDKIKALAAAKTSEQDAKSKEALAKEAQKEAMENLKDARAAVNQMLTHVAHRVANVPQMEPLRRDLLQDALKFHQKFLQKKSDDPEIRLETALAYWHMGQIHHQLGQSAEAEVGYSKAIAMFKELDTESPLDARTRSELIVIHIEFSWVLGTLGKREEIEKNVRRGVQIAEDLVKEFPEDPYYRLHLANAGNQLWGHMAQTRPEEAEKILTRNLTLTNEPRVIADTYHGLGYLAAAQGRKAEAEKYDREALKHIEKYASEQPGTNWLQNSWAGALQRVARSVANDRPQEAEELQRRAIAILDKSATDFSAGPHHRSTLAAAHLEYAGVLRKLNRLADAEKAYRRALDIYDKLATDFGTMPAFQQLAFDNRLSLGQLLIDAGRAQDAQQVYGEAVALPEKLAADFPTKLNHWRGLVRSHSELGRLLGTAGKTREAEAAYGQVVAIQEKLEAAVGGKPEFGPELEQSHRDAAKQLRVGGRPQEAEKLDRLAQNHHYARLAKSLRGALANCMDLVARFPAETAYRKKLADSCWELGLFLKDTGRAPEIQQPFREVHALYEKFMVRFPGVPEYRTGLVESHLHLHELLAATDRLQDADQIYGDLLKLAGNDPLLYEKVAWWLVTRPAHAKAYKAARAVEAAEKAIALAPQEGQYWRTLGIAHYHTGDWKAARTALEKAVDLGYARSSNLFFLAMAHWQLGGEKEALQRYDEAVAWMEQNAPGSNELRRFRDEASLVLFVRLLATLHGHSSDVRWLEFAPDGKTLATGSFDTTVKFWDVVTGKELATLRGHTSGINNGTFTRDGKTLATAGGLDGTIKLWDVNSRKELATFRGHTGGVLCVAFTPDGKTLASTGRADSLVKIWDVGTGNEIVTLKGHSKPIECVIFSPNGETLASGGVDGQLKLWRVATWKERESFLLCSWIRSIVFSPNGQTLAVGCISGTVHLRDATTGNEQRVLKGHSGWVNSVAFSPDGNTLASGDGLNVEGTVKLWDARTGREFASINAHSRGLRTVAFSPDGKTLASGSQDPAVKLWDVSRVTSAWYRRQSELDRTIAGHRQAIALDPKDARPYHGLGVALREKGDLEGTITAFRDAVALDPKSAQARHELGLAQTRLAFFYRDRGTAHVRAHGCEAAKAFYDKYLKLCEEADETEPGSLPKGNLAWAYRDMGDLYLLWEKPATARDYYLGNLKLRTELAAADPEDLDAQARMAQAKWYLSMASLQLVDAAALEYSREHLELTKVLAEGKHPWGDAWHLSKAHDDLAWCLATFPDPQVRDAGRAVELAQKAVELAPQDGNWRKTLGAALYRAGDWQAAAAALATSMELRNGGDGFDGFFLAMALWQLGDKDKARERYTQAVQWMDNNKPADAQLLRFRAEATGLLGLSKPPAPPKEEKKPPPKK